ncbi:BRCA1 associated protein [Willisornis vidua]|uniref:BRCA1 associated protein n=1 Tax=Willisornis vidua TaxID=1566151 RepID=A0ABQ9DPA6_9PASS|nr:BRCA1 associated protein [Willisornis vidua]
MTSLKEDVQRSAMLCILTVPATMTSHDLMKFVASFCEVIEHMKIIRDSTPNQYMVLIKFSSQADADSFYMACNGRQFNSIEEDVCQLVYVERAEVFKSEDNLWICLICGHIGCGRYVSRHAYKHFEETQHTYAMQLTNHRVWDYAGDNYVHRLVASKTDGKLVQYECEGDMCQEEKIDALQLEYSYLLTSQLESQRIYWENKIVRIEKDTAEEINNMKTKFKETIEKCDSLEQRLNDLLKEKQSVERKWLNNKVAKLSNELKEEQELNKCLRANQALLQNKLKEEERVLKETCEQKDLQISEIQEQLRDVMFYLETQQKINHLPAETRQEIQEGQINIAVASSASSSTAGTGKPSSRRGRGKRGKGRSSGKGPPQPTISFDGIYANMRMVHILTSVVGSKCEVQVKNGGIYEGVFKTYSPKCDLVVDAAHRKTAESSLGPKREDILESILFKSSDFVMVHFKDMDTNYARRDAFTDSAISAKVNGEHKEKDLEPWDGGETTASEELEALETDVDALGVMDTLLSSGPGQQRQQIGANLTQGQLHFE